MIPQSHSPALREPGFLRFLTDFSTICKIYKKIFYNCAPRFLTINEKCIILYEV